MTFGPTPKTPPNMTFETAPEPPRPIETEPPQPNEGGKFGKNVVYSRREKVIPKLFHV